MLNLSLMLGQGSSGGEAGIMAALLGGALVFVLIFVGIGVFFTICFWKIFTKAGQPGWAVLVPIYSQIVYQQIIAKPIWWIFVPPMYFAMPFALAKVFGKSGGYGAGLLFLGPIFFPMLAFGSAQYNPVGDAGGAPAAPAPPVPAA